MLLVFSPIFQAIYVLLGRELSQESSVNWQRGESVGSLEETLSDASSVQYRF